MPDTADSFEKQVENPSKSQLLSIKNVLVGIALVVSLAGLYFLSRYNYLLFHGTTEVFTIVVAIAIFTIAWNSRKTMDNNYLSFIGIAFLFIAVIDLLHTLTYKGMGVFPGISANLATQLWISMRYLFAFSLLIPLLFIRRRIKPFTVLASYFIVTTFLILSIFYWNVFPQAYVDGMGLTAFKIGSEYAISIILATGIVLLVKNRKQFSDSVFKLMLVAMIIAIATEMAFTLYTDVYGIANMVGHLLDFFSFFLIYKALVETGFSKPYDLLFRNLKQNENALRESNERFQIMANGTPSLIWVTDKEGKHLFVNKYYLDYFQVTEPQLSGHNWQPLIHPDDRNEYIQKVMKAVKTGQSFKAQVRVQKNNDEWRWMETSASPRFTSSNEFLGHVGISIDITERKKIEEALVASEKKANELIKYAPSGIYELDYRIPPKFRRVNDAMCQILGYSREELLAISPFALLDEESRIRFQERIKKMLAGEKVDETVEFKVIGKGGREIFAVMNVQFTYKDGKPDGALVVAHDITERKKAEMKLVEWAENLETIVDERTKELELASSYTRSLIEASLDPLVTISSEGKITDVNRATENVTGFTRDELIGSDFSNYFNEPDKARAGYLKVFTEGYVKDYPLSIRHKSGKLTDVLYNASIYRNSQGEIQGVFAAARDITERKQAEQKLKDAERLANIGATAGMVGHDIRNPLQAIIGDLFLARTELSTLPDNEQKANAIESLAEIEKNIDYINKIVADLQDYARPLNPRAQEINIKTVFNEILAKNGVPKNIKVTVEVAAKAEKIVADPDYLKRIAANLMLNAVQAMPDGGKLTIRAYSDKQTNDVLIMVKDTGVGISEDIKPKLFTPMVTTKSKGQGFGLAVVKRMTEGLGGTVNFESTEGKGTTFIVRLPPPRELNGK